MKTGPAERPFLLILGFFAAEGPWVSAMASLCNFALSAPNLHVEALCGDRFWGRNVPKGVELLAIFSANAHFVKRVYCIARGMQLIW